LRKTNRFFEREDTILIKAFVRKAPLYQQYPRQQIRDAIWQRLAGLIYAIKIQIKEGRLIRRRLEFLEKSKDSYNGRGVLIIANGPSANDLGDSQITNLESLGFDFIVMNDFYRNEK